MQQNNKNNQQRGVVYSVVAFSWWGILVPVYFKLLSSVDTVELVAHRIVWSLVFILLFMYVLKKPFKLLSILKTPTLCWGLLLTSLLITTNWLLSVWAITHGQILATSLGYFINPLISVLLGVVFLGETLNQRQILALLLVLVAVINQIWQFGQIPWIALGLAISFGIYGLLRKKFVVDAYNGLMTEVLFLLPLALGYLIWLTGTGTATIFATGIKMDMLLIATGIITTVPMIFFVNGSKLIKLSTLGFLQYLIPSLSFLVAIFVYQESLGIARLLSFMLVWLALVLISWDGFKGISRVG